MANFYGILDGSGDVWGVRIPDLPGCHGGGATPEAARTDAISAAREWAEYQVSKGNPAPKPSLLTDVLAQVEQGETVIEVPVLVDSGRPVRANISIDAQLLEDIDAAAKKRGLTRSGFIASAVKAKIFEGAGA